MKQNKNTPSIDLQAATELNAVSILWNVNRVSTPHAQHVAWRNRIANKFADFKAMLIYP